MTAFLFVSLALLIIWVLLFVVWEQGRREQVIMSLVGLVLSPGALILASRDAEQLSGATSSMVGVEQFLFSFCLFGIAAVVYEALLGKHLHKLKGSRYQIEHAGHWLLHLVLVLWLWMLAGLVLVHVFTLSSVQAMIIGGVFVGIYIVADRHDLLLNALASGLLVAMLVFVLTVTFLSGLMANSAVIWAGDAFTTFLLAGVPLEELLWAGMVGFTIGPMYEWLRRYRTD